MLGLCFLGTSGAVPSVGRGLPATLVKQGKRRFLVDCGEGTQLRLLEAGESLFVRHIFLTHDHLDHVLGIGGLLFSLSLMGFKPTPRVWVYGGDTTLERARLLADMIRSNPQGELRMEVEYVQTEPGIVYEDERLVVSAFLTNHRPRPCFAYAFREKIDDRAVVVFTGDTGFGDENYAERLVEFVRGADCLVAEANFASDREEAAKRTGHLTAARAAAIASRAKVSALMLIHISRQYAEDLSEVLLEAKAVFKNAFLPCDLDRAAVCKGDVRLLSPRQAPDR